MVDKQGDSQFLWHAYKNFSILFMDDTGKKIELSQSVRSRGPQTESAQIFNVPTGQCVPLE